MSSLLSFVLYCSIVFHFMLSLSCRRSQLFFNVNHNYDIEKIQCMTTSLPVEMANENVTYSMLSVLFAAFCIKLHL